MYLLKSVGPECAIVMWGIYTDKESEHNTLYTPTIGDKEGMEKNEVLGLI